MSKLLFYFDYSSPFGYLGATQVEALAAKKGAELVWRPFLLGALFKEIGTPMVPFAVMPKAKQRFAVEDMYSATPSWNQEPPPLKFRRFPKIWCVASCTTVAMLSGDF